jgi:adenosine deaminase
MASGPASNIPKGELHVHLEGTVPPALLARIAADNGIEPPAWVRSPPVGRWASLPEFIKAYDDGAALLRTAADYRLIAYDYLMRVAAEGAIYVELTASPAHAEASGVAPDDHFDAIADAIDAARAATGIECRIIVTAVRDLGPASALQLARDTVRRGDRYVVGFGLAGDEEKGSLGTFAPAFEMAAASGLGCTVHAGESCGPESVWDALSLPVQRIGHGVRSVEDPALLDALAEREIVLELCPSSNVALGVYPDYESFPYRTLVDAGIRVTLNSDDPPYFDTSLAEEYSVASMYFGTTKHDLLNVTQAAVDAAFMEPDTRRRLRARIDGVLADGTSAPRNSDTRSPHAPHR